MSGASVFLVLVVARALALPGRGLAWSPWWPVAYLWQDAAVALAFTLVRSLLGARPRAVRSIYAALTIYVAIDVAVMRVLSTPLTWTMIRAARGPLADSIGHYATASNLLAIVVAAAAAIAAPRVTRRVPERTFGVLLTVLVVLGPVASSRVDTVGRDRNAWSALVATALPHLSTRSTDGWRREGLTSRTTDDLGRLRGAAAGRNVVMVSLESTAAQYLGLYGGRAGVMSNLERLARSGIAFDAAYAVYPESIKGLYSVLCSAYPAFDVPIAAYAAAPCPSLAAVLAGHGYSTALFHSGRFMYLGMEAIVRERGYDVLADAGDIGGNRNSSFGVDEPATVARMLQWIDARPAGRPFFLTYLPIAGHHPYATTGAGPFPDRDEFGRYLNALHEGDEALGRLMDGLRSRGLAERTVWIIFGDHGEAFGQHEGNYGHTFNLYEENVHVPMLLAIPGVLTQPIHSTRIVSLVDVAPTTLDLTGLAIPARYQGRSMLAAGATMALFFADYSRSLLGLRDGSRKVIHSLDSGRTSLFDLAADPGEAANVADTYPAEVRWYVENLRGWSAAQKRRLSAQTHEPAGFRAAAR